MFEKFTARRRQAYLNHVKSGMGITNAAKAVGIDPRTVGLYRKANPEFQALIEDAELESCAPIEDKLRELCLGGNLLAIMYFLGNRSGGKWRDVRRTEPKTEPILDNQTQRRLLEDTTKLQEQWKTEQDAAK